MLLSVQISCIYLYVINFNRVEEEFQKKRAREKASIRQQLRMYNLEDKESNNLLVTSSPVSNQTL